MSTRRQNAHWEAAGAGEGLSIEFSGSCAPRAPERDHVDERVADNNRLQPDGGLILESVGPQGRPQQQGARPRRRSAPSDMRAAGLTMCGPRWTHHGPESGASYGKRAKPSGFCFGMIHVVMDRRWPQPARVGCDLKGRGGRGEPRSGLGVARRGLAASTWARQTDRK